MTKSKKRVSEAVARAGRTAPQGGVAWLLTEGVDAFFYDLNDRQYGILVAAFTMLMAFIQTKAEDGIGWSFLRNIPKPETSPVIDTDKKNEFVRVEEPVEDVDGRHEAGTPQAAELVIFERGTHTAPEPNPYLIDPDAEQEDYQ